MLHAHVAKVPASWAEFYSSAPKPKATNGLHNGNGVHSNGYSNGHTNGNGNRYTNGNSNGLSNGSSAIPESFLEGKSVRSVYGLVPLKLALDWPIFASYDELLGCAAWMGGRIPTFEEVRSIYTYVDFLKKDEAERQLGKTVPAVNGYAPANTIFMSFNADGGERSHLVNNGVEETPPSKHSRTVGGGSAKDLFIDLDGANVGFQHWHPVPVTARGHRLAGQSDMGGVWEWTSSVLEKYDGFEPMALYPGYTGEQQPM
jgi:L-histidine Nalpha-methyltransferase / hercynylcysteine S-oxide synthase